MDRRHLAGAAAASSRTLFGHTLAAAVFGLVMAQGVTAPARAADKVPQYKPEPGWLKLPEGRTEIGSMHGRIDVSSAGEIYINVEGTARQRFAQLGPLPGLQVYAPDGHYLRNVPNAPWDLHGFIIHKDADGQEYIYAPRTAITIALADQSRNNLQDQAVIKMTLDGKMVMTIPFSAIPDQYKKHENGQPVMRLTSITVAPNGDLYVSDGYGNDYIHRFDKTGKYIQSFGGSAAPYGFKTLHNLIIDTRYTPARIIACDRANNRIVHLSLNGDFLGVVAKDLMLPAGLALRGDYVAVAELRGRVVLLDKSGAIVSTISYNTTKGVAGNRDADPSTWTPGLVTAPHGLAFDHDGNIFVADFNTWGRVDKFDLVK